MHQAPVAYLNSNDGNALLAFGQGPVLRISQGLALDSLQTFLDAHSGRYIFGCLSYDLKNEVESLQSSNRDRLAFPLVYFWVPQCVVSFENDDYRFVQGEATDETMAFVREFIAAQQVEPAPLNYTLQPATSQENYLQHVRKLQHEIQLGTIYEVNYCQEFFAENVEITNPLGTYFRLNRITRAPYSSFIHFDEFMAFCGSPECFLSRRKNQLRSFPIKGTRRRGSTPEEDLVLREQLRNDTKERSENVMIVDLVRNDLSRIATKGSVHVDELFGIYTFETVHQMISTISCELQEDVSFTDILRATFPMGSMTGAPKISAMQLIEQHEDFRRGLYSGSIGFIAPNGDFDFNVVIRTLLYNSDTRYLSCPVGGAITINSIPENEYEECQVKVMGILERMHANP